MQDLETIAVYNKQISSYTELMDQFPEDKILLQFARLFKQQSRILDLGCGPAISSATLREQQLQVDPVDASSEMVKLANDRFNINARQATFDDIGGSEIYHGIWANFSLLHAQRKDIATILKSLHEVLKPGGYLHLGLKTGTGSKRDKLGRFYTYYTDPELRDLLSTVNFTVVQTQTGSDLGLAGDVEPWIAITSQRC